MFTNVKHPAFLCYFENESERGSVSEVTTESLPKPEGGALQKTENQTNQESLDAKKGAFLDAQKKTVALGSSLETIANNKVEAVLKTNLYDRLEPEARKRKIQELVNEFMMKYKGEYEALKANLEGVTPPLPSEEIQKQLEEQESFAFEQFINEKKNQIIEKRREKRRQRYLKTLVPSGDEEKDKANVEKIEKFDADYSGVRKKILEERPELLDDKEALRKEIRKAIDAKFIAYCEENGIEIDPILLFQEAEGGAESDDESETSDVTSEYIQIVSEGSILQAQDEYLHAAKELTEAVQIYQQERSEYLPIEYMVEDDITSYSLPSPIDSLSVGESTSFLGTSGSSDIIYEATREPDGEYTLEFNGHTMKNLPKKEVELIVDLNTIPVINTIFSVRSELYRTLLREYKVLCLSAGTDPLENPPLGFIDFLYARLSDAYMATLPENGDSSLIGKDMSDMPYKDRGKYIRTLLSSNMELKSEILKKLETQKILIGGRINLSRYPR